MAERSRRSPVALAEWAFFASCMRLLAWLPEGMAYAAGESLARLAFRLDRRHRAVTLENLRRAFPDRYGPAEVEALARAVFANLGRTAVDVARFDRLLRDAPSDAIRLDGLERLRAARARGQGVLVIMAHFGPWELLPAVAALRYEPVHIVVRPLDNPWLDDLLTRMRERGGGHVISKRDAGQAILQALRRGETVGILIDQHVTEKEGIVVPFFGRPASTVFAPALIAMRSGAAVFPVGITREGRGRYCVRIRDEVALQRSGDLKQDLAENTARFSTALEAMIRERPDQWFWVHRRWKTPLPVDPRLAPPAVGLGGAPLH
jgi:KDO2-lipid IV(A) lauroyltransferase